jgi:hypothetical protein
VGEAAGGRTGENGVLTEAPSTGGADGGLVDEAGLRSAAAEVCGAGRASGAGGVAVAGAAEPAGVAVEGADAAGRGLRERFDDGNHRRALLAFSIFCLVSSMVR